MEPTVTTHGPSFEHNGPLRAKLGLTGTGFPGGITVIPAKFARAGHGRPLWLHPVLRESIRQGHLNALSIDVFRHVSPCSDSAHLLRYGNPYYELSSSGPLSVLLG
jgi:hypothetical protein